MQPNQYLDTTFEFTAARNKLRAYVAIDPENAYKAILLALIASGCDSEEGLVQEATLLTDHYVAMEIVSYLHDHIGNRHPWHRRDDGTFYLHG